MTDGIESTEGFRKIVLKLALHILQLFAFVNSESILLCCVKSTCAMLAGCHCHWPLLLSPKSPIAQEHSQVAMQ